MMKSLPTCQWIVKFWTGSVALRPAAGVHVFLRTLLLLVAATLGSHLNAPDREMALTSGYIFMPQSLFPPVLLGHFLPPPVLSVRLLSQFPPSLSLDPLPLLPVLPLTSLSPLSPSPSLPPLLTRLGFPLVLPQVPHQVPVPPVLHQVTNIRVKV